MDFRIADTFTDSLARLTGEEQKAVKTTAFDLQLTTGHRSPTTAPGMSFHKLEKAKDKNFWSVRVSSDMRIIVHKTVSSLLLCFVGHHDKAYDWAERRKLETHPKTGAAQLVEIRETVKEITVPVYVQAELALVPNAVAEKKSIFAATPDDELLGYGVPMEWLDDVKKANEDTLLSLADHLPAEAAEALLELATGGKPKVAQPVVTGTDPFAHPDAQRRFRTMNDMEELKLALEYPWDKWTIFLHPSQRQLVERDYNGPARISGSAGTGKTIVALHRAVFLARKNPDSRLLLATFSETLANALRTKLRRLISNEPSLAERLEIHAMNDIGARIYQLYFGRPNIASRDNVRKMLAEFAKEAGLKFSSNFLMTEWDELVDAWQLDTWEAYRDVKRLGRKTRLPEAQRSALWSVFDSVRGRLKSKGLTTYSGIFSRLAEKLSGLKNPPFEFVVVDESQDISVAQLRFLSALGAKRPNSLFFAGDLGQRIFQNPFSWKSLGVDIRGRSRTLNINYRTSHQIRMQADRLLETELSDVDGNKEERRGTVSAFNGPMPVIRKFDSQEAEIEAVSGWLSELGREGFAPNEIGVFVRSDAELARARKAVAKSGLPFKVLDEHAATVAGHVSVTTMHLAKGLEFRAVFVMACDDEIIPLQERVETVADESDLEEVYNTERHLLYVACTRARDRLFVSSVTPGSEFLDDLEY